MILWYKNSFLASVVSIIGSALVMVAIYGIIEGDMEMSIPLAIVGIPLILWGKKISNDKAFKVWWKQIEDNNLEPQIAQDVQLAVRIYNKNPEKRTLNKIAQLNPAAAEYIRQNTAKK